jgi:hypothetical protein
VVYGLAESLAKRFHWPGIRGEIERKWFKRPDRQERQLMRECRCPTEG